MSQRSPLISYPCVVCCKPTARWCTRCQSVWYCSSDHLQADWARHKKECRPLNPNVVCSATTPPPLQMRPIDVAALIFMPNEEKPRIQVITCQSAMASPGSAAAPDGTGCPDPLIDHLFPAGRPGSVVLTQGLNNETLRYPLQLWYCPASLNSRAPLNKAVDRITSGKAKRQWHGPVVVLKFSGSRRQGYADATSNDLPALSAYFLEYK